MWHIAFTITRTELSWAALLSCLTGGIGIGVWVQRNSRRDYHR